jgi:hypothetical protein
MNYQITVRYGGGSQRYHTFQLEAPDAAVALTMAGNQMPAEIAPEVDLVELRIAVDPEKRSYLEDEAAT